ncbi:MAG: LPXTG cell wall anchor domain-containing protein [Gemmata sp.]
MEFLSSWYTMGGMFVALLVLIGLMIFLRNNKKDEE